MIAKGKKKDRKINERNADPTIGRNIYIYTSFDGIFFYVAFHL